MIALIQRVSRAEVEVDGACVGRIGPGLLALVAIEPGDGEAQLQRMLDRLLGYRIFPDAEGRMNRSLADTGGGLLLVSQFTLAADTRKGMRPSFTSAASPERRPLRQYSTTSRSFHAASSASRRFTWSCGTLCAPGT